MITDNVDALADIIARQEDALLLQWREQIRRLPSARELDVPTLNDHIPGLLAELTVALRTKSDETIAETLGEGSPPAHGRQQSRGTPTPQ